MPTHGLKLKDTEGGDGSRRFGWILGVMNVIYRGRDLSQKPFKRSGALELAAVANNSNSKVSIDRPYAELEDFSLLSEWYYIPLMDLLACEGTLDSAEFLSNRLGVSQSRIHSALREMLERNLLERKDGKLRKASDHVKFATLRSHALVRNFHAKMIEKAQMELKVKTSQPDFDRRLITGLTVSVAPERIQEAKALIFEMMNQVASVLTDGAAQEVYQFNIQLFPLTRPVNIKRSAEE